MKWHLARPLTEGRRPYFLAKNTRANIKLAVQNMLEAQVFHDCEQYLGLPMIAGKSKTNTFK